MATIFELAQRYNDKFNSDLRQVRLLGDIAQESVERPSKIGRNITSNSLSTYNNLFNIADRKQNFKTDLEASRFNSLENRGAAKYGLNSLGDRNRLTDLQRDLSTRQTQNSLDTFDEREGIESLSRQIQRRQNEFQLGTLELDESISRLGRENQVEQLTFDRVYQQFQQAIGDPANMSSSEYFDRAYNELRKGNTHPNIRSRVDSQLKEELKTQQQYIDKIVHAVTMANTINLLPESKRGAAQQGVILDLTTAVGKLDDDLLKTAISNGIIETSELPPILLKILNTSNPNTVSQDFNAIIAPLSGVPSDTSGNNPVDNVAIEQGPRDPIPPQSGVDLQTTPVAPVAPLDRNLSGRIISEREQVRGAKEQAGQSKAVKILSSILYDPNFSTNVAELPNLSRDLQDPSRNRIFPSGLFDGSITPNNAQEKVDALDIMLEDLFVPPSERHPYMKILIRELMRDGSYTEEEAVAEIGKIITERSEQSKSYIEKELQGIPYENPFNTQDSPVTPKDIQVIEDLYGTRGTLSGEHVTFDNFDQLSTNLSDLLTKVRSDVNISAESKQEVIKVIQLRAKALRDYRANNPHLFER